MTRKNALAGLWWGGGKGIMVHDPELDKSDPEIRATLYREYGTFITSLRGCYVTAEDAGTKEADMAHIYSQTRFTTCIHPNVGGSGNPGIPTAHGVVCGIVAALEFLDQEDIRQKTVAVQGLGNVGLRTVRHLLNGGVKSVVACDADPERVEQAKQECAGSDFEAVSVRPESLDFLATECDVLVPCATGGILNPRTIPEIRAAVVCGAANNQLEDSSRDDRLLYERGITYIPDFLTNRMGIVNCANEQYGYVHDDPMIERHLSTDWEYSIHQTVMRVLKQSQSAKRPPGSVALSLADELALEPHPIFGHRGKRIIESLVESEWHNT
jgi:glutamate dehydrogenase/leucine dehydrogenase